MVGRSKINNKAERWTKEYHVPTQVAMVRGPALLNQHLP